MNLDFRIIELQKRGISLISLGKMTEFWFFFFPKRAFANFFLLSLTQSTEYLGIVIHGKPTWKTK